MTKSKKDASMGEASGTEEGGASPALDKGKTQKTLWARLLALFRGFLVSLLGFLCHRTISF